MVCMCAETAKMLLLIVWICMCVSMLGCMCPCVRADKYCGAICACVSERTGRLYPSHKCRHIVYLLCTL